jgi:hypothetical protein
MAGLFEYIDELLGFLRNREFLEQLLRLNVVVELLAPLLQIWKIPGSDFGLKTFFPD